jgi:hypothetical protein
VVRNQAGKGQVFYLNLDMHDYAALRAKWPRGAEYLALFEELLGAAGVEAAVKVRGARDVKIRRFSGSGSVGYIALLRNPNPPKPPGAGGVPETPVRIQVMLSKPARVHEQARDFGMVRELDLELDPWRAAVLECRPGPGGTRLLRTGRPGGTGRRR